jgi:hypothetical protein
LLTTLSIIKEAKCDLNEPTHSMFVFDARRALCHQKFE